MLLSLNWELTLLSTIPIPLVALSLRIYAKYVRPAFRKRQKELGDLNAILNDNLSGIREIKAFTREKEEANRIQERIEDDLVALGGVADGSLSQFERLLSRMTVMM